MKSWSGAAAVISFACLVGIGCTGGEWGDAPEELQVQELCPLKKEGDRDWAVRVRRLGDKPKLAAPAARAPDPDVLVRQERLFQELEAQRARLEAMTPEARAQAYDALKQRAMEEGR